MMKYDGIYFANRYNFFTCCVEWYFLSKTEINVFLKKNGYTWFWLATIDMYIHHLTSIGNCISRLMQLSIRTHQVIFCAI